MEQGLNSFLLEEFSLEKKDINTYSPLVLAYIGDSVFDIVIKTMIVGRGNKSVDKLHRDSSRIVSAKRQAKIIKLIEGDLSEEEKAVCRRGRNAKPHTTAKNASVGEYREATGFEALIGWLYLNDNWDRIVELVKAGIREEEK